MRILALFAFATSLAANAQSVDTSAYEAIQDVRYIVDTTDNYPGYEYARSIVDYYHSYGVSLGDRYSYEVVIVDSLLMCAFHSPGTEDFNFLEVQYKKVLTSDEQAMIDSVLAAAHVSQRIEGVPHPTGSAYCQDVLVLRNDSSQISGGMFYIDVFNADMSDAQMDEMIQHEQRTTSSLGGDYDAVMKALEELFDGLPVYLDKVRVE